MVHTTLFFVCCLSAALATISAFTITSPIHRGFTQTSPRTRTSSHNTHMVLHDVLSVNVHWIEYAAQGIADAVVCPAFGEKGWAPFCFLNGNPLFNAFDGYQQFIQNSVVSLHDLLKNSAGIENAYGPSIIIFTILIRLVLFPLNYQQLYSSQKTQALTPKIAEIKKKFPDDKNIQNQMVAALYEETKVNPLAGCLPALVQIPVFLALYRSFLNLASTSQMNEPFLWLPNLQGPVFGARSLDWLTKDWIDGAPSLGWHDSIAYLTIPVMLVIAQSISLRILTPPSDDPAIQRTQRFLKYLPLMLGYFALSVPSGLGVYWVINNALSTVTTASIKEYFKRNPLELMNIDLDKLASNQNTVYSNPAWGYRSESDIIDEARLHYRPARAERIPADFV